MSGPAPNPFASNTELLKGKKKKEYLEDLGIPQSEEPTVIPTVTDEELAGAGVSEADSAGGGYGKKRIGDRSRKQANLTGSRGSSILTSKSYG